MTDKVRSRRSRCPYCWGYCVTFGCRVNSCSYGEFPPSFGVFMTYCVYDCMSTPIQPTPTLYSLVAPRQPSGRSPCLGSDIECPTLRGKKDPRFVKP